MNTEKKIDYDYAARVEKEVAKKYGNDAIDHPKANWNIEKEKQYIQQAREMAIKEAQNVVVRKELEQDVLIDEKLFKKTDSSMLFGKKCPICEKRSQHARDEVYFKLYGCCYICSIKKGVVR